jgi:flagellar hook-associated protein 3 FlgL
MRVNPNNTPDLIASLSQLQQEENTTLAQMASGRRVAKPSDDPAAAGSLVQVLSQSDQIDTYTQNATTLQSNLQLADSTLNSVVTALERAATLGINAANATLSDSNRSAIAQELQGIQDQVLSLANTSSQGTFLFAGTASTTKPFVADNTSSTGVSYAGNGETNSVEISSGYQIQTSVSGSDLFLNPSGNVFQSLQDLITAVQNDSGIDTATNAVGQARSELSAQRVFYGNAMNQLKANSTVLQSESTQLSDREITLSAADLAQAATQLVSLQTSVNAVMSAASKTMGTSLFDYLSNL